MAKKRTYSTQSVEKIDVEVLIPALLAGCIVALDVAKQKFVFALSTLAGEIVKLVRFDHPTQTQRFLEVVSRLNQVVEPGKFRVAMEPTGTYGDSIRHQLVKNQIPVWMVSPKKTYDSRALFDDVQSLHDPKSAVNVAKLCAMGLAREWSAPAPYQIQLRALVQLRSHEFELQERCFGRMEALLARHWPEFGQWLDVRTSRSALFTLASYPSPAHVSANVEAVEAFLRKTSRGRLSDEKIRGVLASARASFGVPPIEAEERLLKTLAEQAASAGQRAESIEQDICRVGEGDDTFKRLASWMGAFTAASFVTQCNPTQYATTQQLEKACGLNLREKSSGNSKSPLHITKRGPSLIRKLLYLFALRMIRSCPEVRAWYMSRRSYLGGKKTPAIIAVMRKLLRAAFHVARGSEFDPAKLFDLRRLDISKAKALAKTAAHPFASRAASPSA